MFDDIGKPKPQNPSAGIGGRKRVRKDTTPRIRHQNPKVAEHVARVALKHAMDMPATVKEIAPDASPAQVKSLAETLEKSPTVQEAVKEALIAAGLDENSKNVYVQKIWGWFNAADKTMEKLIGVDAESKEYKNLLRLLETQKEFALNAARILGKAFIAEKVDNSAPAVLQIKGFEEGVKRMLGGTAQGEEEEFDFVAETEEDRKGFDA